MNISSTIALPKRVWAIRERTVCMHVTSHSVAGWMRITTRKIPCILRKTRLEVDAFRLLTKMKFKFYSFVFLCYNKFCLIVIIYHDDCKLDRIISLIYVISILISKQTYRNKCSKYTVNHYKPELLNKYHGSTPNKQL